MKKIKLLKALGCVALIAAPVIAAPIVLITGCSTTEDPTPEIKVDSIQGIKFKQKGVDLVNHTNNVYLFNYITYKVANINEMPKFDFSDIAISFLINNNSTPVALKDIFDLISFSFICSASVPDEKTPISTYIINENKEITTTSELWKNAYDTSDHNGGTMRFVYEDIDSDPGYFLNDSLIQISYGLKTSDQRQKVSLERNYTISD